jgi:hypothetical protein
VRYDVGVDPFLKDEIERARRMSESDRLLRALEVMAMGIELKRTSLRERYPEASERDLEAKLEEWLAQPHD